MDNLNIAFKSRRNFIKSAFSAFLLLLSIFFLISLGLNKREITVERIILATEISKEERQKANKTEKKLDIALFNIKESPKKLEKMEIDTKSLMPMQADINYLSEQSLNVGEVEGLVDFQNEGLMVFEIADLDKIPKRLKNARIQYPSQMLKKDIEGEVRLLVLIDEAGELSLEKVLFATNEYFEKAAILALKEFKYEAPLKMGKKVKARYILSIPFNIERIK